MGLLDTLRRAVGGDSSTEAADESTDDSRPADDGPDLLEPATLDPMAFRGYAERAVADADPLTFDPDALARLDTAIEESDDWTTAGETAAATAYTETTVQFGSYLGELLVRAYDGEWVQSDGRWGVTVAGPDDEVTVAVFDVAARSFDDEPVFAAVAARLESELALDALDLAGATPSDPDDDMIDEDSASDDAADPASAPSVERAESATTAANDTDAEPTRVVSRVADDAAAAPGSTRPSVDPPQDSTDGDSDTSSPAPDAAAHGAHDPDPPPEPAAGDDVESTTGPWDPDTLRASHAETAVDFAAFWSEHDLDFTPPSLSRLDELVDAQWDTERFAETMFGSDDSFDDRAFTSVVRELGGYFGEVLVRHLDGEWTDETDHEAAVVVSGDEGQFAVPVFEVAMTSLRTQSVFGRSYDALLADLGRDGPRR